MGLNGMMPEVFDSDITSVNDYLCRIQKIKKFIRENRQYAADISKFDWTFFYRGDRYCSPIQSNFFRYGNINDEANNFKKWINENQDLIREYTTDFEKLAYMQHYSANTRLLDFTTDPKVALRFACGQKGDNCRKKVTLYNTACLKYDDTDFSQKIETFMQLVKSKKSLDDYLKTMVLKDYFIEMPQNFPRIKRQKGLFLLMGNFTTSELLRGEPQPHNEKVKHELSPTKGRGDTYEGYVGVLSISPYCVEQIRDELEHTTCYRMDYLMGDDETR